MPYGAAVQPIDYSFIGQAGTTLGKTIQQLPAAHDAMLKRKRLEENLKKLGLRKQDAELIRRTRVNEALEEYKTKMDITDPEMSERIKTKIESTFWPSAMISDKVDDSLKQMSDNDTKFTTWLDRQVLDKTKKAAAGATQRAVAGGEMPTGPERETGRGFTETDITTLAPAQTREEAMSRYAEMVEREEAPILKTEELEQQPGIAALPERPEPPEVDPLFDLKKKNLELRNATEVAREKALRAAAQQRADKPQTEGVDRAIKDVMDMRFTLDRSIRDDTKLISALNTAIKKQEANEWDNQAAQALSDAGYTGPTDDIKVLKGALVETQRSQADKKGDLKELKSTERNLIKKGTGPIAKSRLTAEQETLKKATDFIQQRIAPRMSAMGGSVRQILSQLPPEYQGAVQRKVEDLKTQAAEQNITLSDYDIFQMLTAKRKQ